MNDVVNLVLLHELLVVDLITDIKALILAGEFDLCVAQISGENCTLGANLIADGLGQGDTNLSIGSSHEDLLAELYS